MKAWQLIMFDENDVAYRKAFRKAIKNWRDDKQLSPEQ